MNRFASNLCVVGLALVFVSGCVPDDPNRAPIGNIDLGPDEKVISPWGDQPRETPDLSQFDKDGDGKISQEEKPQWMGPHFAMYDGNQDGFVTQQEFEEKRDTIVGGSIPDNVMGGAPPTPAKSDSGDE